MYALGNAGEDFYEANLTVITEFFFYIHTVSHASTSLVEKFHFFLSIQPFIFCWRKKKLRLLFMYKGTTYSKILCSL